MTVPPASLPSPDPPNRQLPIAFLGGVAEDEDLWREALCRLTGATVLEARPSATAEPTVESAARAVAAVLTQPSILVGHSLGGLVALTIATHRPELTAGVVLVCSGHPITVNPRIYDLLARDPHAATVAMGQAAASDRASQETLPAQELARRFAAMASRSEPSDIIVDLQACESFTPEFELLGPGLAIIALAGADDRMLASDSTGGLADALGIELTVVPGVGHQLPWQRPDLIADACERIRLGGGLRHGVKRHLGDLRRP